MKKTILILGSVMILVLLAVYVTNHYGLSEPEPLIAEASEIVEDPQLNGAADEAVDGEVKGESEPKEGSAEIAPSFTLLSLDGESVSLEELRGQPVYLHFWATWCKWCIKEMPEIEKVYQEYKERGLVLLAIAVGEDEVKVDSYLSDKAYTFQFLLDPDKSVTRSYGIKSIPVSMMIDRDGNIIYKRVGAMNEEQIRAAVKLLFPGE